MNRIDRMVEAAGSYNLCGKVTGLSMKVHSALGSGFLESVDRNAVALELKLLNFRAPRLKYKKKFRVGPTEPVVL